MSEPSDEAWAIVELDTTQAEAEAVQKLMDERDEWKESAAEAHRLKDNWRWAMGEPHADLVQRAEAAEKAQVRLAEQLQQATNAYKAGLANAQQRVEAAEAKLVVLETLRSLVEDCDNRGLDAAGILNALDSFLHVHEHPRR
jgi:hypothetical protein